MTFRRSIALLLFLAISAAHAAESAQDWAAKGAEAYAAGDFAASAAAYEEAFALGGGDPITRYYAACSHALNGQADAAFRQLSAAVAAGFSAAQHLAADPDLESLHKDPRWAALLQQVRQVELVRVLRWGGRAFETEYRDQLDVAGKVAGLSRVWAEAKFGFANFDLVPELDWDSRYIAFIPKVIEAESTYEYYRVLQHFIAGLHDGHSNVYPPPELHMRYARPLLRTALIEDRVVIRKVMDSATKTAGFRRGQEILSIDGVPVKEYARREVQPYQSASTPQDLAVRTFDYRLLAGDVNRPVMLKVRDADGTVRTLSATRVSNAERRKLRPSSLELAWLPGDVAHVKLNGFGGRDIVTRFERALPALVSRARGVILDVRDNGGGNSDNGYDILAHFSDGAFATTAWEVPRYTSTWRAWSRAQRVDGPHARSRPGAGDKFDVPVVLLIGPRTYSAAEDFAVAFDQLDRGVMIGEPTGGSTGQPVRFSLPGGGSARICTKRDRYIDGTEFVGVGVQPDITVSRTVAAVRTGRDLALERAREWIANRH